LRVLVTGATGLIGSSVVERLAPGNEMFALSRRGGVELERVEWVQHDLTRPLNATALPGEIDAIVHLAQWNRYRDFPDGAMELFAVNVQSTAALLEYARGAGAHAFVLASTGGCYARSPDPIDEEAPLTTPGPYFRSKRMAELLVENYASEFGGAILRFFFAYGPGGKLLVARLAAKILTGEEIAIDGDPGMAMNPIYVDDAAAAVEAALGLGKPATINIAGDEVVRVRELVERLAEAFGRDVRIRPGGASPGDLVADTSRMRSLLGIRLGVDLDRGLRAVAETLMAGSARRSDLLRSGDHERGKRRHGPNLHRQVEP
jgi:UDP-glucose 4-epimerase